jgi:hypothetical protein
MKDIYRIFPKLLIKSKAPQLGFGGVDSYQRRDKTQCGFRLVRNERMRFTSTLFCVRGFEYALVVISIFGLSVSLIGLL